VKSFLAKTWRVLSLPKSIQLLIMRASQDQFLIGVTGIIFNAKHEVLLFKHSYRQTQWSLPGGYMKAKEHPFEGLEREIAEESGLIVSVDEQLKMRTDRETSRIDVVVVGTHIGGEFNPSHEVTEFGFFAFNDVPLISKSQLLLIESALQKRHPLETFDSRVTSFLRRFK
jgi:8-oxo-dGTP diphosphatase